MHHTSRQLFSIIVIAFIFIGFVFVISLLDIFELFHGRFIIDSGLISSGTYTYAAGYLGTYIHGYLIVIFTLFVCSFFSSFKKTHRKIEVVLLVVLGIFTIVLAELFMGARAAGICTLSIPEYCQYSWVADGWIGLLLLGTILLISIFNVILLLDIWWNSDKQDHTKVILIFIIPFVLLTIISLVFRNSPIYVYTEFVLMIYLLIISIYNVSVNNLIHVE